jgi:integrase
VGRRSDGIRAWYDETAQKWHIRDPFPDAPKAKFSLGFGKDGPEDDPTNEDRAWEEVRLYKARKMAGQAVQRKNQPTDQVRIADIITLYVDKRITNWVKSKEYKTPVSRPDEVKDRLKILVEFFKGSTLDAVNRSNCEDFGKFLHQREIRRAKALYDRRMAIYIGKKRIYDRKVAAREDLVADLKERGRNRTPPPLRSLPPVPLPPFNPDDIEYRPSASRRYLEDLSSVITCAVLYEIIKHKVTVHLPPKYDKRLAKFTMAEVRRLYRRAFYFQGMGWINRKPVQGLFTRRHLARFIFIAIMTGSRKDKIERVGFVDDGEGPWVELWETTELRTHRITGERYTRKVWNGIYHRLGDDEIAHDNKQAPSVPVHPNVAARFARWKAEGIAYPCAYPYHRDGIQEPRDVSDGMRAIFDEFFGEKNDAVIHTFRHTVATWMCAQGKLPMPAIAAYLGMSLETLVKIYAKHRDEDLDKIAGAIFDPEFDTSKSKLHGTKRVKSKNARQKSTDNDRMKANEAKQESTRVNKSAEKSTRNAA